MRIENLLAVRKIKKNFKFENLTLAPIDKSLIEKKLLNKSEIRWLNNYHSKVYYNLKKYMSKNDLAMFKNCCSNI
jgi:Xaa-Pro aminopeptidase